MDDITFDEMFANITPTAIKAFGGKKVIFLVITAPVEFEWPRCPIKGRDGNIGIIADLSDSYEDQQNFVIKHVLSSEYNKIIVETHSPVILSDAFACQIYTYRKGEDGVKFRYISRETFGTSPSMIASIIFNLDHTIGNHAEKLLHQWMTEKWTIDRMPELEAIINQVGNGWPKAKLQKIYDEIGGSHDREKSN